MKPREFLQVDPASLHLPGVASRRCRSAETVPTIGSVRKLPEVKRGNDGELVIFDGVTRATRVAKYLPGTLITVEVTGRLSGSVGGLPTVGEKL